MSALQDEAFEILNKCPFGVYDGHLIQPRHMSEADIVAWVEKIYAWKERAHAEKELRVSAFPCLGTKGTACEPIDVDRLPAVMGVITGVALLDVPPCDNCRHVEQR